MRSNKAFPLEVSCPAADNGKESGTGLVPHCDFGRTGNPAVLIGANVPKGIKPMDIPSRVSWGDRLTIA